MDCDEVKQRQRMLHDVLRSSAFYNREGLYGSLKIEDDNYESVATLELATQLNMDLQGAKKVFKLLGLIHDEDACHVLKENAHLDVFAEYQFTKGYTSISNSGGTISTDFLEAFINGENPNYHESKLRKRSTRRKLDAISLRFTKEAMDLCTTMFLKAAAVVATLCSFMPSHDSFYPIVVINIIQRYLSSAWKCETRQKLYHKDTKPLHFVDGWLLVGEVFKVSVQELVFWKDRENEDTDSDMPNETRVDEDDLRGNGHRFCQNVVSEFSAWCYQYLESRETVKSFLECFFGVLNSVNEQLFAEMGCSKKEPIPKELLEALLNQISDDGPTMADVKYDSAAMRPSKREARLNSKKKKTAWNPKEMIMRCRWEDSTAQNHYASFLKTAKAEQVKGHRKQSAGTGNLYQPGSPNRSIIPETPPKTPTQGVTPAGTKAQEEKEASAVATTPAGGETPPARKRRHTGFMVSLPPADENIRTDRSKRLKVFLEQNLERLRQGGQQNQQSEPHNERDPIANFLDDGDISDDDSPLKSASMVQSRIGSQVFHHGPAAQISPGTERGSRPLLEDTNLSIHLFYEAILDWPIMPIRLSRNFNANKPLSKHDEAALSNLIDGDTKWSNFFWDSRAQSFCRDVTAASSLDRYREHWRHILHVEVRGTLSDEIAELLPSVKEDTNKDCTLDIAKERFIPAKVNEVAPCKGIFNIVCRSTSPALNKRIVRELQCSTICVGYIEHTKQGTSSPFILILCRRVQWKEEDESPNGTDGIIDEVQLSMVISRDRVRYSGGIWKDDDILHFFHLYHFSSYLRMFRSVHEVSLLPQNTARILCGPRNRIEFPEPVMTSLPGRGIDIGCEDYIRAVKDTTELLDHSQLRAVRSVAKNIGTCERDSNSVTLIQGPPGTGKTTLINVLTGALLSHSKAGHMDRQQVNELEREIQPDYIVRCSKNEFGLKILICCPSNQAADNILRRMHEDGIPDGKGGSFRPQAVLLAKDGYHYGDLHAYSLNSKALPFDLFKHHREEPNRKNASGKARRSFSKECLVVFFTLCTAGGSRLKKYEDAFRCGRYR